MIATALTIAGSDPSGGAGMQADLKTFHQLGVYGTSVITLLTVQNTQKVQAVEILSSDLVIAQLDAVLEDIPPVAAKTGALGSEEIIRVIAERARFFSFPLVVDPVMISKHGTPLLPQSAYAVLKQALLPHAHLITPNLQEAEVLTNMQVGDVDGLEEAARRIADLGVQAVLVKGGHLKDEAVDVLYWKGEIRRYSAARVDTPHTHGTGCTFSAAITAELAKGRNLPDAIERAKRFITLAIQSQPGLGKGRGPVNHHVAIGE